jgi:hypothetical protein
MKKLNFLAAIAAIVFAGCTNDDFVGDVGVTTPVNPQETPIVFTSNQKAFTRADFTGAEAADLLNGKFVVSGFKGTSTATPGSMVFDNYLVVYGENTANTTESNSSNWDYVGKGLIPHAVTNGITNQTIKYWDYTQTQYDFFAWAVGKKDVSGTPTPIEAIYTGTPTAGQVLVSNIQPNSKTTPLAWAAAADPDPARIAYTFTGAAEDLAHCYISDIVTVYKGNTTGTNVVAEGYQKPVTMKFRQLGTKVRIGIYETVPGYSVKNVQFYTTGGLLEKDATDATKLKDGQIVDNATIFSAGADIYKEGTYKVYFKTVDTPSDADNNQAHIKFTPKTGATQATTVDWGTLNYTYKESGEKDNGAVYLGRTSNTATFAKTADADPNYYVVYLPNETGTNLNLRVNFTLESIDGSGEIIEVKNAKAQVPSIYTTWKPGYAYTYLFKISDNTNGRTGVYDPTQADDATINSDPAGLYPITFDAMVENAEDNNGTQETITTIATPSITTYQQKSTVVNADEYTVNGKDIFVTVNTNANPGALIAMNTTATTANGVALYSIPAGMTEAEVVDALTYQDTDDAASGTILGRNKKALTILTNVASDVTLADNNWKLTNTVEFGANGNPITVNDNEALRFTPVAGTTYAFVYTETAATSDATKNKALYEPIKFSEVSTFSGKKYRYAYIATTKSHTVESTDYFDAQKGHVYFTETSGTYAKVANPFIGQGASNLFTRSGSGPYTYTKATTDYAVSGTTYYYTTNGQTYTAAHTVTYNTNCSLTGLYKEGSTPGTYVAVDTDTEKQPVDGVAYYFKSGDDYIYCVFMPQQVNGMFELDTAAAKVETTEAPVDGQTYFDKYTVNDAVRYAKVIKVQ